MAADVDHGCDEHHADAVAALERRGQWKWRDGQEIPTLDRPLWHHDGPCRTIEVAMAVVVVIALWRHWRDTRAANRHLRQQWVSNYRGALDPTRTVPTACADPSQS
jgi:hypothetical protein